MGNTEYVDPRDGWWRCRAVLGLHHKGIGLDEAEDCFHCSLVIQSSVQTEGLFQDLVEYIGN